MEFSEGGETVRRIYRDFQSADLVERSVFTIEEGEGIVERVAKEDREKQGGCFAFVESDFPTIPCVESTHGGKTLFLFDPCPEKEKGG